MASKKYKILVYGGSGQIGSVAVKNLSKKFEVVAPTHEQIDVTDRHATIKNIDQVKPDQILYCAGYTNTDGARQEIDKSFLLNCGAVLHIAYCVAKKSIPFHYLSTELVFNGEKSDKPYTEEDLPDPLLINGKTKRLGELATLSTSKKNSVLRLIMCYSAHFAKKSDLARLALSRVQNGQEFTATKDQKVNPIFVETLVEAIGKVLEERGSGIYQLGATDYTTPFEFSQKIIKRFGLNSKLIKPTTFAKFSKTRPEPRPKDQWLNTKKFVKDFGKGILKSVDEGIEDFYHAYQFST